MYGGIYKEAGNSYYTGEKIIFYLDALENVSYSEFINIKKQAM